MDARKRINKLGLANALRKAGRQVRDGKSVDFVTLLKLIKALREHWPEMCATLTDLIEAAQDEAARGDWFPALEHFRAASRRRRGIDVLREKVQRRQVSPQCAPRDGPVL